MKRTRFYLPLLIIGLFLGQSCTSDNTPENEEQIVESSSEVKTIEEDKVRTAIMVMMEGLSEGDSVKLTNHLHKSCNLKSVYTHKESGEIVLEEMNYSKFVSAVLAPRNGKWFEEIYNIEIKIDGEVAQAWVPYKFYFNDEFSHCGVDAIQLAKLEGVWKIIDLTDTRRKENCL